MVSKNESSNFTPPRHAASYACIWSIRTHTPDAGPHIELRVLARRISVADGLALFGFHRILQAFHHGLAVLFDAFGLFQALQ